jgi:hypothetical protein
MVSDGPHSAMGVVWPMTGNSSSILRVADNRGVSRQHTRAVSLITRSGGRILFATSPLP